jgi:hypothetical protein
MLTVFDRRSGYSRREFLRIGTLGLGGLTLPQLLSARAQGQGRRSLTSGKSVIFLYQFGGPSQFETFDPKMSAPDGIRSVTGEIPTAIPGLTFGSSFPQLARRANKFTVVRSYVPAEMSATTSSTQSSIGGKRSAPVWVPFTRVWRA